MSHIKYSILIVFLLLANITFAQRNERDYLRKGNKLYKDSAFVKAEVNYRKGLELNPQSVESMYNLGNSLSQQNKSKEAMEQYDAASRIEKNKTKLAKIYHNMGVLLQSGKQYQQCIEAYKQSLRNNPKDDETRYNLALAQKMLKDQQKQNQDNKDNKDDKKKEQEKKEQEQKKQDDKKKEDQQQQPPKPEKQKKDEMSKENAQQLLNAAMQDEKQTQDKVKKQLQQVQSGKLDKDW
ncbi:MAG: tetratricopeptide repeat protein [Bacteroidaceae bacterium]